MIENSLETNTKVRTYWSLLKGKENPFVKKILDNKIIYLSWNC